MKKSQLKKLIQKTIKEAQLGAFQSRETPHDLDPQDLEYYLDQIQGMSTDEAIFHLGKLGLTSGQSKKVISQLDTGVSDMFRGHSDYEDPFPSTKKGIGDLDKHDLYEGNKKMKKSKLQEQITNLYQQGANQELRMEIRKMLKESLQEWEERFMNENLDPEQTILDLGTFRNPDHAAEEATKSWEQLKSWIRDELMNKGITRDAWNSAIETHWG